MKPWLVLGASGQVGRHVCAHDPAQFVHITRHELNFESENIADELKVLLEKYAPCGVISLAAYTDVASAEKQSDKAMQINAYAPGVLAAILAKQGLYFIHASTDYVFSGHKHEPYTESDAASPLNAYGKSKYAGEQAVLSAHSGAHVLRFSWVYDHVGKNFLCTILGLAANAKELRLVADQVGAPSYAADVATMVIAFAKRIDQVAPGIYHAVPSGHISWHGFAWHALMQARSLGLPLQALTLSPVLSEEYDSTVKRPKNSQLCNEKFAALGIYIPHWRDGLARAMQAFSEAQHANH